MSFPPRKNLAPVLQPAQGFDFLLQQRIERPGKFRSVERLNRQLSAVNQKGRRAANAQAIGFRYFGLDDRRGLIVIDTFVKRGSVQSHIGGVLFQIRFGEIADEFTRPGREEFVVIFPELALSICALGGVCRPMRFVDAALCCEIDDGIVAVRELDFAGLEIVFIELALRAKREFSAVRSLIVGPLDKFDFGVRIAFGAP